MSNFKAIDYQRKNMVEKILIMYRESFVKHLEYILEILNDEHSYVINNCDPVNRDVIDYKKRLMRNIKKVGETHTSIRNL